MTEDFTLHVSELPEATLAASCADFEAKFAAMAKESGRVALYERHPNGDRYEFALAVPIAGERGDWRRVCAARSAAELGDRFRAWVADELAFLAEAESNA